MCKTPPITVKWNSREDQDLNCDRISEHRALDKHSLPNRVTASYMVGQKLPAENAALKGTHVGPDRAPIPMATSYQATSYPINQTFLPNILFPLLSHYWFLPPVVLSLKQTFPPPWPAKYPDFGPCGSPYPWDACSWNSTLKTPSVCPYRSQGGWAPRRGCPGFLGTSNLSYTLRFPFSQE